MMRRATGGRGWQVGAIGLICAGFWLLSAQMRAQGQPPADRSPDGVWQLLDAAPAAGAAAAARQASAGGSRVVRLNRSVFESVATRAPVDASVQQGVAMTLPMPDGTFARFRIVESPMVSAELSAAYPQLRTYRGQGIDDPAATVRLGWTELGFHAIVLSAGSTTYVDPYPSPEQDLYQTVRKDSAQQPGIVCLVERDPEVVANRNAGEFPISHGASLRTYRMAIAATAEYTAAAGGTKSQALARIVATMNRVNGIFEREIAVTTTLTTGTAGDPTAIIFTDSATDGYTNGNPSAMMTENQTRLTAILGASNFDVGHVFGTLGSGGSGIATLGVPCRDAHKAKGASTSSNPTGDGFAIELVAHEIGHQFDASHTYNGTSSSCGPNRDPAHAYEVGSGSTIMSYSGSCSAENLALSSGDYFHFESLNEMTAYITSSWGATCGTVTSTGNTPPVVSSGGNFNIPANTPFQLTATGSDANGDSVTYTWEELDLGTASSSVVTASTDDGSRPLFRSYTASANPWRVFPRLDFVLNNANVPPQTVACPFGQTCLTGEALPSTNRLMNFHVTARDNRAGGGGIASASTVLSIAATTGPFQVTSPNTVMSLAGNSFQTVTWNSNGTALAPVNATNVKVSLSTDGGATFPTVLLASTPNDGAEGVIIPNTPTSTARIKIEAVGNVFFDVSNSNFSITPGVAIQKVTGVRITPP